MTLFRSTKVIKQTSLLTSGEESSLQRGQQMIPNKNSKCDKSYLLMGAYVTLEAVEKAGTAVGSWTWFLENSELLISCIISSPASQLCQADYAQLAHEWLSHGSSRNRLLTLVSSSLFDQMKNIETSTFGRRTCYSAGHKLCERTHTFI